MRNALPSLICVLVAYIYVAAACPDIKPVPNFNVQKMLGKWYLVGFATDQDWFMATKRDLKGSTIRAVPTIEGDMDLYNSNMGDDGLCWRLNYRAYRSDTPGRFVFKSKLWENDNDMRIVDTVYDRYAMVYAIQSKDGMDEALTMLWSRSQDVHPNLQQKFKRLSIETGIHPDNVMILEKNAECNDVRTILHM